MKAVTRKEENESTPVERLAPEDLAAIRRWIVDREVAPADDAVTISDIAEATGLPAIEVQTQLDRIREERAHQLAPAAPRLNQKQLLAFAVVLFVGAGAIRVLTPRPLTDEEYDARVQQIMDEKARNRKPKPIHYPIESKVAGPVSLPATFDIVFTGPLTKTTLTSNSSGPAYRQPAIVALTQAIRAGYDAAREAEAKAPIPKNPIPKKPGMYGQDVPPGNFGLMITGGGSGTGSTLPYTPPPGVPPAQFEKDIQLQIENMAKGLVEGTERSQEVNLKIDKMSPRNIVMPPPGFSVMFKGREQISTQASPLTILPIDPDRTAKKLEFAIRNLIWRDALPPDYGNAESRALWAKRAVEPFSEVVITGPSGPINFRLPMIASPSYPTAADSARASERILKEGIQKAIEQVLKIQKGGAPR